MLPVETLRDLKRLVTASGRGYGFTRGCAAHDAVSPKGLKTLLPAPVCGLREEVMQPSAVLAQQ